MNLEHLHGFVGCWVGQKTGPSLVLWKGVALFVFFMDKDQLLLSAFMARQGW